MILEMSNSMLWFLPPVGIKAKKILKNLNHKYSWNIACLEHFQERYHICSENIVFKLSFDKPNLCFNAIEIHFLNDIIGNLHFESNFISSSLETCLKPQGKQYTEGGAFVTQADWKSDNWAELGNIHPQCPSLVRHLPKCK